jgi:hypothetical protein
MPLLAAMAAVAAAGDVTSVREAVTELPLAIHALETAEDDDNDEDDEEEGEEAQEEVEEDDGEAPPPRAVAAAPRAVAMLLATSPGSMRSSFCTAPAKA